jgi:hypothetical protein
MPQLAQRAHQRIIAETVPAIHAARARSDLNDIHLSDAQVDAKSHPLRLVD